MQFQHIAVTYFKSYTWELHHLSYRHYIYISYTISFASNNHHVNL